MAVRRLGAASLQIHFECGDQLMLATESAKWKKIITERQITLE